MDNIKNINIQVELCHRPSVPSIKTPVLYRATSAHHKTHIIHTELNSVTNITTSSSTVYVTDKSCICSVLELLGDVLPHACMCSNTLVHNTQSLSLKYIQTHLDNTTKKDKLVFYVK